MLERKLTEFLAGVNGQGSVCLQWTYDDQQQLWIWPLDFKVLLIQVVLL